MCSSNPDRRHRVHADRRADPAHAHKIADFIYEKLTGERGVFSTRVAYVVKQGSATSFASRTRTGKRQSILISSEPIMSPAWSPDGARMAYVSFQNKKPILFVQNLTRASSLRRSRLQGSNSAPAWSPDGKQLAAVLTKDGTSQIYLMSADGGNLRRLTVSGGIDTDHFSPRTVNPSISPPTEGQPADLPHAGGRGDPCA